MNQRVITTHTIGIDGAVGIGRGRERGAIVERAAAKVARRTASAHRVMVHIKILFQCILKKPFLPMSLIVKMLI
jgi:hypothetical protein